MGSFSEEFERIDYPRPPKDSLQISEDFYEHLKTRRSIRSFSSEPVDERILINAIRSAGTAPSGANRQPWFFALITDDKMKQKLQLAAEAVEEAFYNQKATQEWLDDLKPFGTTASKPYLTEAPALIAVFSRTQSQEPDGTLKPTYYPIESTGLAVGMLLTALHHAGLATLTHTPRPMFFLNQTLGLDRSYRPFMIIVIGLPSVPTLVPKIRRKPLHDIFAHFSSENSLQNICNNQNPLQGEENETNFKIDHCRSSSDGGNGPGGSEALHTD